MELGYDQMKQLLLKEGTDFTKETHEAFRDHVVVSYVSNFCNPCLRLRPVMDKVSMQFSRD